MKRILTILCLALAACSTPPPPAPVVTEGRYVIREYSAPGRVINTYQVTSYSEQDFPRRITFTHRGSTITLSGSYQVDEFAK